jgi:ATP-dependent protease HslVU (ClpYQ) peptidase subunit
VTTVVAEKSDGVLTFASDTQVTDDGYQSTYGIRKVWTTGNYLVGAAGDTRALHALHLMKPVHQAKSRNLDEQMLLWYPKVVEKYLTDLGIVDAEFEVLIGIDGEIFYMDADYDVSRIYERYYAIGSGSAYALGALSAGGDLKAAMKASMYYDVYTGGKVEVITSPPPS